MRRLILCVWMATGPVALAQGAFEPDVIPSPSGVPSGFGREGLPLPNDDTKSSIPKTAPDSEQLKSAPMPPKQASPPPPTEQPSTPPSENAPR